MTKTRTGNRKLVVVLLVIVAGMFGFGFVLIPIYRIMANVYGFGGQVHGDVSDQAETRAKLDKLLKGGVDKTRSVTLEFMVTANSALNLEFRPLTDQLTLHPGEVIEATYFVKNLSDRKLMLQALPTVSPNVAGKYVVRYECPCFQRQVLKPGESRAMSLKLAIDPALPKEVQVLTLSYRLIEKKQIARRSFVGRAGTG